MLINLNQTDYQYQSHFDSCTIWILDEYRYSICGRQNDGGDIVLCANFIIIIYFLRLIEKFTGYRINMSEVFVKFITCRRLGLVLPTT